VNLQGIDSMFENDEGTRLNTSIEAALTKRDEFGRVMTPKEAFRQLCYAFHGKAPSKNKQEKRLRKYQEELAVKKMEAGDTPLNSVDRLRDAQNATAQPYLVLSGKSAASETSLRAAVTKKAAAEAHSGGLTPMLGDKKVSTHSCCPSVCFRATWERGGRRVGGGLCRLPPFHIIGPTQSIDPQAPHTSLVEIRKMHGCVFACGSVVVSVSVERF
jgi:hypothetical protein